MPHAISRLTTIDELRECSALQQHILGSSSPSRWTAPLLSSVIQSGGLILGMRDEESPDTELCGTLVDLVADAGGHRSRHTVFRSVRAGARGKGIGQALRAVERTRAREEGVAVITWAVDPLRSVDAHIAFNKLGAIATGYVRNLYGEVGDLADHGLATDRLQIEWWLESPRTISVCDRGRLPPHYQLGLNDMTVVTQTTLHASGVRSLTGHDVDAAGRHVLVEIPVDLDRLRAADLPVARAWRIQTRELFELLFEKGYVVVGFVHEGGRSFHLLERTDRGFALGRER